MSTPRPEIAAVRKTLADADDLTRRAEHARKAANLAGPAVGLGVQVGALELRPFAVEVMRAALVEAADRWDAEAAALEAKVALRP